MRQKNDLLDIFPRFITPLGVHIQVFLTTSSLTTWFLAFSRVDQVRIIPLGFSLGWALFAQIHRIISFVQYVVRGHMGSLYVDFHCSRSSGTPSPFYSLISTQKQASAKFEKWPPFSFLLISSKWGTIETWGWSQMLGN